MASCSEACATASGSNTAGEAARSEAGSSCRQFGVRSYLHHFYEECTASVWERDPEDRGFVQSQTPANRWSARPWKVSLALGLLFLTSGLVSMMVGHAIPRKIESFGEGDLLFIDTQAVSFNKGLHLSVAAGIGLSCLGSGLGVVGALLWFLPRSSKLKERLLKREEELEKKSRGVCKTKSRGLGDPGSVVTKAPGRREAKVPATLSKVKNVQPSS
ncbi:neurensin 1-like [Aplochiton taeniatus]